MGDACRGVQLLLAAEQVVCLKAIPKNTSLELSQLTSEDGRVSFKPSLRNDSDLYIKLDIHSYSSTADLVMIHCKMIGGSYMCTATQTQGETSTPWQVAAKRLYGRDINPAPDAEFLSKCIYNAADKREKLTVIFMVYEIVATRPVTGAGLHLNRARLQGAHCDVKLVVSGVELAAHRAVLAARSPVLDKMLSGDFKEAREGRVELVDFPAAAVEKFIEFLYTDRIEDWGKCELELLRLADMYMVPDLKAECSLWLWNCGGVRALEVLHAAGVGPTGDVISGKLRQRLATIVVDDMHVLADTQLWADFKATHPVLVDMILGSAAHSGVCVNCTVWSP